MTDLESKLKRARELKEMAEKGLPSYSHVAADAWARSLAEKLPALAHDVLELVDLAESHKKEYLLLAQKNAELGAEVERLRGVLDWYASVSRPADEYSADCGERARAALKGES